MRKSAAKSEPPRDPARAVASQPNLAAADADPVLALRFWAALVATGLFAGFGAGALMLLLDAVEHLAWSYPAASLLDAVESSANWRRVAVLTAAGMLAGVVRWWLGQHEKGHAGDINTAIWRNAGRIPFAGTAVRAVLSIVIVGMGAALGREGAPKQIAAAAASRFSDWAGLSDQQRRLLAACGAGAGMAAVYDVPVGGALFALEVLLGTFDIVFVIPAFIASGLATAIGWLLLGHHPVYDFSHAGWPTLSLLVWSVVAAPVIGIAAAVFIRMIAWANARHPSGWVQIAAPAAVFASLGAASIVFPQLLGNGRDVVEQTLAGSLAAPMLAALLVLRLLATTLCLASGAPGGLFTPTMTCGALLGGLLGDAWTRIWPDCAAVHAAPGSHAFIAAAAFLAATTQAPVSAIALTVELTRGVEPQIVPVILASTIAVLTTRRAEARSVYTARG